MMVYLTAFALIVLGIAGMLFRRNLLKIIMALSVADSGAYLLLIAIGYRSGGTAPILTGYEGGPMVDPLPQALVLTAIVIGVCVLIMAVSLVVNVYRHYGTLDVSELRRLRG